MALARSTASNLRRPGNWRCTLCTKPFFGFIRPCWASHRDADASGTNILTQICGNNFMVLKAALPLVVSEAELDEFVNAIRGVVESVDAAVSF